MTRLALIVPLSLLGLVASGCYSRHSAGYATTPTYGYGHSTHAVAVVHHAPPRRVVYVEPGPSPYDGGVWVHGHWTWSGSRYTWVDGHWIRPRRGYVYVQPRWRHRHDGRYVYHRGHWKPHRGTVRVRHHRRVDRHPHRDTVRVRHHRRVDPHPRHRTVRPRHHGHRRGHHRSRARTRVRVDAP